MKKRVPKQIINIKALFAILILLQIIPVDSVYANKTGITLNPLEDYLEHPPQFQIQGVITDAETGEQLPGVNVVVKGTSIGTVSDFDGLYEIQAEGVNSVLVFSSIGYKSVERAVGGNSRIDIALAPDQEALDEVVVIGYGTQKKSDLTGSIVSVSAEDIANQAVTNVQTAIVGQVPGVYAATGSGQPGSGAMIRIRGFGTVNNNDPLYVVDGQFIGDINNINPYDIDRLEILKDASATAIYGSRGANGVVVITTKKGKVGKTAISFDNYTGTTSPTFVPRSSNRDQLYNYLKESYENDGLVFPAGITKLYDRGVDTDWWDVTTRNGFTQNTNFSIRGGTDKLISSLSLGYVKEEGYIKTTSYDRITANLSAEYSISSKIKVGGNFNMVQSNQRGMEAFSEPIWQIVSADPFSYVYNPLVDESDSNYRYNKYAPTEWAYTDNPLFLLESNNSSVKKFNIYGGLYTNIEIIKGLNYKLQFNVNRPTGRNSNFYPIFNAVPSDINMGRLKYRSVNQLNVSESNAMETLWQQTLSYNTTLAGKHNLSAVVGLTKENNKYESIGGSKTNFPSNDPKYWILDAGTSSPLINGGISENSLLSYLGRINYSYDDRYLVTASFRADGSSRFTPGNRWGHFPSFSVGWKLSNETFIKNLNIESLSELKFRAGWGQTGNQNISDNAVFTTINTAPYQIYTFGGQNLPAYGARNTGNPNLQWETSEQTNFGMDIALFNNQLSITADYFIKDTKDMLLRVPVPKYAGYPNAPYSNAGSVKNSGFELAINWKQSHKDFYYEVGANASVYKNEVTKLGDFDDPIFATGFKSALTKTEVGGSIGKFYGYEWDGHFQNQAEINAHVGQNGDLLQPLAKPGDFRFKDTNGDGLLNDDDRTYIGSPHPDLIFGANLRLGYKDFDFSAQISGTLGNDIWNEWWAKHLVSIDNAPEDAYEKAWRKEGDGGRFPRITQSNLNNNGRASSWYVEDGSYVRLKNVQLGYSLPKTVVEKSNIFSSARIYVSGQNLFTITNYKGMDPEIGTSDPTKLGFEITRYPTSRILTLGINAQF